MLIRNCNRRALPKKMLIINHRGTISLDRRFSLGDACLLPVQLVCLYLAYLRMLFYRCLPLAQACRSVLWPGYNWAHARAWASSIFLAKASAFTSQANATIQL